MRSQKSFHSLFAEITPGSVHHLSKLLAFLGFFHDFKSEEIVAKKWDKAKETFSDEVLPDEEVSGLRLAE